jgi:hypothetical protein
MSVTRRQWLTGALTAAFSLLCPRLYAPAPSAPARALLRARLSGLVANQASARIVGQAYLRVMPAEFASDVLLDRLVSALHPGVHSLDTTTEQELRDRLLSGMRQDFRQGRVVSLEGWIVSTTEARLCALAALSRRSVA